MRNDEEGILAGIKIIDLRCKFAMQMFDPYSSMNSLWTAVVVKFQILSFENLFIEILLSIEKIPNRNRLTKAIEQIQKWQVLAVSCIHAFSSPS
jgi:hypothetical protein